MNGVSVRVAAISMMVDSLTEVKPDTLDTLNEGLDLHRSKIV